MSEAVAVRALDGPGQPGFDTGLALLAPRTPRLTGLTCTVTVQVTAVAGSYDLASTVTSKVLGYGAATEVVIEHDLDVIAHADWIIELGPGAGRDGGHLVFAGPPTSCSTSPARPRPSTSAATWPAPDRWRAGYQ